MVGEIYSYWASENASAADIILMANFSQFYNFNTILIEKFNSYYIGENLIYPN